MKCYLFVINVLCKVRGTTKLKMFVKVYFVRFDMPPIRVQYILLYMTKLCFQSYLFYVKKTCSPIKLSLCETKYICSLSCKSVNFFNFKFYCEVRCFCIPKQQKNFNFI